MEFLIISSTKMKVKLSEDEVKRYSLSDIESERVETGMRKGLWQLIDIAKERHGFSCSGEKLLVQFYKSDLGGELFITKLLRQTGKSEKLLDGASNITLLFERRSIYKFTDADSLIRSLIACNDDIPDTARLYFSDEGCYYLIFTTRPDGATDVNLFSEYGEPVSEALMPSILEHSVLLGDSRELASFKG